MFRMKAGIELRKFRREATMMPIRPYLIYVAAAREPQAESTSNKWSNKTKKHKNVKLIAYKKKLIGKGGRKRRKMNSCDKKPSLSKK